MPSINLPKQPHWIWFKFAKMFGTPVSSYAYRWRGKIWIVRQIPHD